MLFKCFKQEKLRLICPFIRSHIGIFLMSYTMLTIIRIDPSKGKNCKKGLPPYRESHKTANRSLLDCDEQEIQEAFIGNRSYRH